MKSDKAAPRYVTQLHQAQRWSTLLNSGVELCSPHKVPSWDKTHQHPTTATPVRSAAPRQHTNISRQTMTDSTRTNPTAVRSPAPRYTHPNTKRTRTNPYKTWTLHLMVSVINIMALLYNISDGGAEPCSPPANTTLATCNTTMTHHELVNGGAERCSPPKTPSITTVRSPAPRPCHYSDYSVNATNDSAKEPHQQLGLHPVLNVTPLSLHFPQRLQTRNCRNTAFSHRSTPPFPNPPCVAL